MVTSNFSLCGKQLVSQSNSTSLTTFNFNSKFYYKATYLNSGIKTYSCITNPIEQHLRSHTHNPNNFKILHQNVRGLTHKTEEFLVSLSQINPQVLCLTEHHLKPQEISIINLGQYTLGAHYCRRNFKQGRVSIFILHNILFHITDLKQFNKEKDFEICALKIHVMSIYLLIL